MNAHRAVWVVLPLALGAAACDNPSSGAGAASSASAAASAPAASSAPVASISPSAAAQAAASASALAFAAKGARRQHAGLAGVLLRGAYESNLTDDQKATLEKLEDGLNAEPAASPAAALKIFHTDVVTGIRASKLDNAKLQADYAAIDKATQAAQAREADALNGLHAALDAAQRQALVDQIKAKRAAHEAHEHPPAATDGGAPDWVKKRVARLTMELTLDDAQQKSVSALLAKDTSMTPAAMQAKRDASQKRVEALLAAFAADPFDAKKLDLSMGPKSAHDSAERTASFTSSMLGILHPDQREKLAVRTERMGNRPPRNMEDVDALGGGGPEDEPMMPRMR
jgi:hypothetical protein